jgi:hypothetical protein
VKSCGWRIFRITILFWGRSTYRVPHPNLAFFARLGWGFSECDILFVGVQLATCPCFLVQ